MRSTSWVRGRPFLLWLTNRPLVSVLGAARVPAEMKRNEWVAPVTEP